MRDATRLARACNAAGVTDGQFAMACVLLACVGIDAALALISGLQEAGRTRYPVLWSAPADGREDGNGAVVLPAGVSPGGVGSAVRDDLCVPGDA
jgi:hypothetical protein